MLHILIYKNSSFRINLQEKVKKSLFVTEHHDCVPDLLHIKVMFHIIESGEWRGDAREVEKGCDY